MAIRWTVLAFAAVCVAAALITGMLTRTATAGATQSPQGLEGSWFVTDPGRPGAFAGLSTFSADGAAFAQGPNPRFSPAHGRWTRTGEREFAVTVIHLVSEGGQYQGTRKHGGIITLDATGNSYVAEWATEDFDRDGNPIASSVDARQGSRISVEPSR